MSLAMGWYAVDGRKWFKGPRINVQHIGAEDSGSDRAQINEVDDGDMKKM